MLMTTFPVLAQNSLAAANTLGAWLARNDFSDKPAPVRADVVILAGNAVIPTIDAACQLAAAQQTPLLISGGVGHSTTFLYSAIARHPRYNVVRTTGRGEAAILADIAHKFWSIDNKQILIEDKSTNCGENVRFSMDILAAQGIKAKTALVVQDPTMQRRTMATFARLSQQCADAPHWLSWPGFTPQLVNTANGTTFVPQQRGLWSVERYLSLLMGEVPRLRDDANGYGPNGHDFIVHVDFPPSVEAAWQILRTDTTLTAALANRAL
ncbi:YdcF family protein [Enterobacter sp. Bisph1]|uniref:YdcF family protein n=1 Tax=Enterobacter sp. Bisph1 TaxID=1274399 RepID=UPI00057BCF89|nr:YdcF family protein [Enterobacter sp. Bisph1]